MVYNPLKEKDSKKIDEEYEEIKKNLIKQEKGNYSKPYIMKQLRSKPNLRKVFISTIKHDPALVHEISNDCLLRCESKTYPHPSFRVASNK